MSVQEALMCGLPAIVSDDPSFTANLGATPGVSITTDDTSLREAIRGVFANEPARDSIATAARAAWGGERFLKAYEVALVGLAHAFRR